MTDMPRIRPATSADANAVFGLMRDFKALSQSISPVYDELSANADVELRKIVDRAIEEEARICLVAVADDGICGFLIGSEIPYAPIYRIEGFGHVSDLFVTETYRSHGVGAALMAEAESHFRARGLKHMSLESIVHYEGNKDFYEGLGYSVFLREFRKAL